MILRHSDVVKPERKTFPAERGREGELHVASPSFICEELYLLVHPVPFFLYETIARRVNMSTMRTVPKIVRPALQCQARRGFRQTAWRRQNAKPETPAGAGGASGALTGGLVGGSVALLIGVRCPGIWC